MPNWCSCDLTIKAEDSKFISRFMSDIKWKREQNKAYNEKLIEEGGPIGVFGDDRHLRGDEVLSADSFIPYPEGMKYSPPSTLSSFSHDNEGYGYGWCIKNWGTKWDLTNPIVMDRYEYEHEKEDYDNCLGFTFSTAWSPPLPLILEMSRQYPDIEFILEYYENGMSFRGLFIVIAGETQVDEQGKYYGPRGG